jgi:MFS family permease
VRRYAVLVRAPHGLRLVVGTAIFYPGQAALGLVVLLALHHATGTFASAGAAIAAETVGFSLSGLAQGRLIDRRGTVVIARMTAFCAVAVTAMIVALSSGARAAVLVALAAVVGASIPAVGPALRTVWSSLLDDPDERSTAFAYMSLAQDAGFVVGPAAFGAVAVTVSPEVALACCSALIGAGSLIAATVAVRSRPVAAPSGRSGSLLRALATVAAVMAVLGVALRTRLFACSVALSILALGPVAAPSIALAAPICVLAGLPLGATITTAFLLASESAPTERQTESYALLSITLNGGAALGGVLAGQLVAHGSARSGFLLAVASGLFATAFLALVSAGDRMRMSSSSPS